MPHRYPSILIASALFGLFNAHTLAQCLLSTAVDGPVMPASTGLGGTENRSGVAYNPQAGLYYSVDAGSSSYPLDTYDATFNLIDSIVQAYDYRGAWWNSNTLQFEGNGFAGSGIFAQTLDGAWHPLGAGSVVLACAQPEVQSCGTYDEDANEIVYYYNGSIDRYDRATGTFIASTPITGLPMPVSSLNSTGIGYTGCTGHEYVVYDYVNFQAVFIDKATMAYAGYCQLPLSAPPRSYLGLTYANGYLWIFDIGFPIGGWHGYLIAGSTQGVEANAAASALELAPNPASKAINITLPRDLGTATLEVIDAMGRVVLTEPLNGTVRNVAVNIEGLREGAYHARVRSAQGVQTRSFVIAR